MNGTLTRFSVFALAVGLVAYGYWMVRRRPARGESLMDSFARPVEAKNERRVCEAVLRDLAKSLGVSVLDTRWVDQHEREKQAIELEARTTGPTLSLEHTRVEAYGGQIGDGQRFLGLVWELEVHPPAALVGPLGVTFDLFATRRLKGSEIADVVADLTQWLISVDGTFRPGDAETRAFGSAGVQVTAQKRTFGKKPLIFSRRLDVGFDIEKNRLQRIAAALDKKLPKLKAANGHRVLILESNDIALSNHVVICEALLALGREREWLPEYIYVVETENEPWLICPFKEGDQFWPSIQRLDGDSWYYNESI